MVRLGNFGVMKSRLKCLVFIPSTFSVFRSFIESFIDQFTDSVFTKIAVPCIRLEARKKNSNSKAISAPSRPLGTDVVICISGSLSGSNLKPPVEFRFSIYGLSDHEGAILIAYSLIHKTLIL